MQSFRTFPLNQSIYIVNVGLNIQFSINEEVILLIVNFHQDRQILFASLSSLGMLLFIHQEIAFFVCRDSNNVVWVVHMTHNTSLQFLLKHIENITLVQLFFIQTKKVTNFWCISLEVSCLAYIRRINSPPSIVPDLLIRRIRVCITISTLLFA